MKTAGLMIEKWETTGEKLLCDLKIFKAYEKRRRNLSVGKEGIFTVLDSNDWVNVIPVTSSGNILMVEQYRHGTDSVTIEIPGGLIEPGEDACAAGKRECTEETGYCSESEPVLLGCSLPNPAFLNNRCTSYAGCGVEKKYDQKLDRNEDINIF